jgi:hypothetical protein
MDQIYLEFDFVDNRTAAVYGLYRRTQQAVLLETMTLLHELGISTAPRAQELLLQGAGDKAAPANDPQAEGGAVRRPDGRGQAQARPMH